MGRQGASGWNKDTGALAANRKPEGRESTASVNSRSKKFCAVAAWQHGATKQRTESKDSGSLHDFRIWGFGLIQP
jgi:hypothetical protein